jgi:hypothetical protein
VIDTLNDHSHAPPAQSHALYINTYVLPDYRPKIDAQHKYNDLPPRVCDILSNNICD